MSINYIMVDSLLTPKIMEQLLDPEEPVMVCEPIRKLKAFGGSDSKKRLYVMSFERIYTFKDEQRSRLYLIKDVGAIIESNENETDFMLFFERSDDLHVSTTERKIMLDLLKLRFNATNRNITLRHFSVNNKMLVDLHRNNNEKNKIAGIYDLPEDSHRLRDLEVKGEEEYNADLRRKKGNIDDNAYELAFEAELPSFGS